MWYTVLGVMHPGRSGIGILPTSQWKRWNGVHGKTVLWEKHKI